MHDRNPAWVVRRAVLYLLSFAVLVFVVFPFLWAVLVSFRTRDAIFAVPPRFIAFPITIRNYRFALQEGSVLRFSLNSVMVAGLTVFLSTILAVLAAYAVSRFSFRGKGFVYFLIGMTQVFPVVVIIIPLYMVFRQVGLYNTLTSLVIAYTAISVPISIVLMSRYLNDIPTALEESAEIDGCSKLQTMFRVIIPLATPGIVATAIYIFINIWQEYLIGMSLISDSSKYTLTVGLSTFRGLYSTDWGALMATAVIITVPAMFAFALIQRHLIDSLAGSIKG